MHPMDMNWYFDHDDLNALQQRAVYNADANEHPYGRETRWLKLNADMLQRALICTDYNISHFNIKIENESSDLCSECWPQNLDWLKLIDNKIDAFLYCTVNVSTTGEINRSYFVDLVIKQDYIKATGEKEIKSLKASFL